MFDETIPAPGSTTFRALIQACDSGVSDAMIAHARLLGPELAGDTVASLLESELSHPTCGTAPIVAAHLAHEPRLTYAVPALVHCLERQLAAFERSCDRPHRGCLRPGAMSSVPTRSRSR